MVLSDSEVLDLLQQAVARGLIDAKAHAIVRLALDKGTASLSRAQRFIYDTQVFLAVQKLAQERRPGERLERWLK